MSEIDKERLMEMAADIVTAYVSNNTVPADQLSSLFENVFDGISKIAGGDESEAEELLQDPAVPIEDSLSDDAIICLEDGQSFQSLKRHLRVKYNLTPEAYRKKWGLPPDYPMVAPNYAKRRSALAKKTGLGKNR